MERKEKLKLKFFVIPTISFVLFLIIFISTIYMQVSSEPVENNKPYVNDIITNNKIPVLKETTKIVNPFISENVSIANSYYDYKASEEEQEKSIVQYDDTYLQSSGLDYISNDKFDVISILDGEVISIDNDERLGNIVKIEHEEGFISVYQSLEDVLVKKGDKVIQRQVIGKSGTNKLDEELGNHLHFELYRDGQMLNPVDFLNKDLPKKTN